MPKIAMLEGYQAVPARYVAHRAPVRGELGSLMCGELDPIVAKLGVALAEARRVGVSTADTRYAAAFALWDKQSGWWSGQDFMSPSTCRNLVTEANSLLSQLNRAISERGGSSVPGTLAPSGDLGLLSGLRELKWIVGGVAVVGGLIYLGPVIKGLARKGKKR